MCTLEYYKAVASTLKATSVFDGLAKYTFSNNILDSSGNGYDFTLFNHVGDCSVTYVNDRKGNPNSAIKMLSTVARDSFTCSLRATIPSVENASQFSISFWVYTNDAFNGIPSFSIKPYFDFTNYTQGSVISMDARFVNINKGSRVDKSFTSMNNSWHHVVWQLNGNACEIYIDGVLTHSFTFTTTNTGTGYFWMQYYAYNTTTAYIIFDDVQIFSTVRTQSEVTALYNE